MSCNPSRISYELFTKCVTPVVTYVHLTISSWQVVTHLNFFKHFKFFFHTWHTLLHLIRTATHRHVSPCTLSRVLPSLARKIACYGINHVPCQCKVALLLLLLSVCLVCATRGTSAVSSIFRRLLKTFFLLEYTCVCSALEALATMLYINRCVTLRYIKLYYIVLIGYCTVPLLTVCPVSDVWCL